MLQFLVECLNLSTHLRVIWSTPLLLDIEFLSHYTNSAIDKVTPLVSHQYLGTTKPSNDIVE